MIRDTIMEKATTTMRIKVKMHTIIAAITIIREVMDITITIKRSIEDLIIITTTLTTRTQTTKE